MLNWGQKLIWIKINQLNSVFTILANFKLILEQNGMSCAPSWTRPEDIPYNIFLFTFGFFLPLLLIIFTSTIAISNIHRGIRIIENEDIKITALARQYKVVKMV